MPLLRHIRDLDMDNVIRISEEIPRRLQIAWKILVFDYVLLAAASWGILSSGADLATAHGRHLLAGALANLALVAMGITITVTAFRRGKRLACQYDSLVLRDTYDYSGCVLCRLLDRRRITTSDGLHSLASCSSVAI